MQKQPSLDEEAEQELETGDGADRADSERPDSPRPDSSRPETPAQLPNKGQSVCRPPPPDPTPPAQLPNKGQSVCRPPPTRLLPPSCPTKVSQSIPRRELTVLMLTAAELPRSPPPPNVQFRTAQSAHVFVLSNYSARYKWRDNPVMNLVLLVRVTALCAYFHLSSVWRS